MELAEEHGRTGQGHPQASGPTNGQVRGDHRLGSPALHAHAPEGGLGSEPGGGEEEVLASGLIPSAPLIRELEGRFNVYSVEYRDLSRIKQEGGWLSTFTADRLLCRAGIPWAFAQDEELRRLYDRVSLPERPFRLSHNGVRICKAPGCHQEFEREKGRGGYHRKVYCSRACRERHYKQRKGTQAPEHARREYLCRNGHVRSPETVETLKDGTRRCRICNRERTQEYRERQRAATATPRPKRTGSS